VRVARLPTKSAARSFGAIVFDYYLTLADPEAATTSTFSAMLANVAPEMSIDAFLRARARMVTADLPRTLEGDLPRFVSFRERWTRHGDELFESLGIQSGGAAFARARAEAHSQAPLYPDVHASLETLRQRGYRLAVLSDADADYLTANIARNGLSFDAVLCSETLGCYKPHESTFLAVCDALRVAPSTVTYVGDGPLTDVQGARHIGMYAIWIDRGFHEWPPNVPPAEHTIASLSELVAVLRSH
jgi:2-haloalkanoic acid dehalogenase type II